MEKISFTKKLFYFCCIAIVAVIALVVYMYFTNEGVANEFRQIKQPKPNKFYIGIDVSATIDPDTLSDLKDTIISRLENFIGETTVSYTISIFGNPGCGLKSISDVVAVESPEDEDAFEYEVEKKIDEISVAKVNALDTEPLTTPLYCLLQKVLPGRKGRVIVFSDLMNDDSDCGEQFYFPEDTLTKFGADKQGQIIFLYPTPRLTDSEDENQKKLAQQQAFIDQVQQLRDDGKVRAYFYHIPDDPSDRTDYIQSKLQDAIPVTAFEVVLERVGKMVDTIVSAVRG